MKTGNLIVLVGMLVLVGTGCLAGEKIRNWTGIVVHHSDSGPETTRDDIDRWHKERGWDGVGYHYVIEWDGTVKVGRPLSKVGAHAKTGKPYNRNGTHIGICLVGCDKFTAKQLSNLRKFILVLADGLDIKSVERHHENCPGPGVDVEALNRMVQNLARPVQ